jgi:hypothetical protein
MARQVKLGKYVGLDPREAASRRKGLVKRIIRRAGQIGLKRLKEAGL